MHVILSGVGTVSSGYYPKVSFMIENVAVFSHRGSCGKDDVSCILKLCNSELQQLNFDRFNIERIGRERNRGERHSECFKRKISKSASEKSYVLESVLQS